MPEKPSVPGFDRCNKCSTASDGPALEPSPATHAEICCLYSLAHPGQSDYGRCQDCPGLTTVPKQQVGSACEPPETSGDPPQGTLALAAGCETEPAETGSQPRKRKKIEPRHRQGFKKLTIEIRPQRFKKKLWFGTYTVEEIDRARDAVNYYMGCNQPYTYPDSPLIFASRPLKGIKFEDLHPSCEDWVQVGDGKLELKYKYFARQVKDVIHSVTGKQKKSGSSIPKRNKYKVSESPQKSGLRDPTMPSGAGSTTSSGTEDRQLARDPSPEANSELSATHPSFLPLSAEMFTYEEMYFSELLRSSAGKDDVMGYSLEQMFSFTPVGCGEGSTIEEEDFPSEILWAFQNEGLP